MIKKAKKYNVLNYSPDKIGHKHILLDIHKEHLDEVLDVTTPKVGTSNLEKIRRRNNASTHEMARRIR